MNERSSTGGTAYAEAAAAFDLAAGDYGDEKKRRVVFPTVLDHLRAAAGRIPLDVGCGNGAFLRFAHLAGQTVAGVERSPELLEFARARDRRLGISNTYACADVMSDGAAPVMRQYDVFTCTFACQDIESPKLFLEVLVRDRERPFYLVVVNESWFGLTSPSVPHHVPRRVVPHSGSGDAAALSIADWGQGAKSVTYCRPDQYYRDIFRAAGLAERSFDYFGNAGETSDVVQRSVPSQDPFWSYTGIWSPAC